MTEANGNSYEWDYDGAHRLEEERRFEYQTQYTTMFVYDAAGNRLQESVDSQTTVYSYTVDDQIDQITLPDLSVLDYAYDDRGNLASITDGSDITAYDFDARDRLSQVTKPDTSSILYAYDHDGRRISETVGTDEVHHVWDEESAYGDIVLDYDENDVALASYVLAGDRLISQERGSTTHYYLMDGQRNVRALSSSAANTTDTYDYDAYGTLNGTSGTTENAYRYTGQRFDSFSELYNLRARDYDATVGRFVSRDTWPIDTFNPVELNRYGYVANNPINFSDPSGYLAEDYGVKTHESAVESAALKTVADAIVEARFLVPYWKIWLPELAGNAAAALLKIFGITVITITLTGDTPAPQTYPATPTTSNPPTWGSPTASPSPSPSNPGSPSTEPTGTTVSPGTPPIPGNPEPETPTVPDPTTQTEPDGGDDSTDDPQKNCEQNPNSEDCDEEERKHITLGLSNAIYTDNDGKSKTDTLNNFTDKINQHILAGQNARAYSFLQWESNVYRKGLFPLFMSPRPIISYVFGLVRIGEIEHIHFNLTGIVPTLARSYTEYAAEWSDFTTSWELFTIMNDPTLCSRTTFYDGYIGSVPRRVSSNICS